MKMDSNLNLADCIEIPLMEETVLAKIWDRIWNLQGMGFLKRKESKNREKTWS